MPAPLDFSQKVTHALAHLYDPDILRKHPLLELFGLSSQPNAQTLLREKLMRGIEELKPSPNIPIESRAWRVYKILHMRYIQQMDQEQTAHQIGVGVRHLRREQSAAVNALADALYQKLAPGGEAPRQESAAADRPAQLTADPVAGEFAWLQRSETGEDADLYELVHLAVQLVAPLAAVRSITLENQVPADIPHALIFPAAMRQALISMTTYAINRLLSGKIIFQAIQADSTIELTLSAQSTQPLAREAPGSQESLRSIQLLLGKHSPQLSTEMSGDCFVYRLRLPAHRPVTVLMIDDNRDVAELFQRYVYGTEFRIEAVSDPAQVFAACEDLQPQVILLDIMIPHIDGWELLGRIRQHPRTQQAPIIVCSALPERDLALALGAAAYLHKPVGRADLMAALKQVVSETN
jgi:CheY-like chemotaxis protein